ncbi:MAG: SpoIIAA family protein [Shimia sp.]
MDHPTDHGFERLETPRPDFHAFRVHPGFDRTGMEAMAKHMNDAMDAPGKIDLLIEFAPGFDMSDSPSGTGWESFKTNFKSLTNIDRYVVVGAPETAEKMIGAMDKIIPVDARTYDHAEREAAWASLAAPRAA